MRIVSNRETQVISRFSERLHEACGVMVSFRCDASESVRLILLLDIIR
jgi:hypothetical protein